MKLTDYRAKYCAHELTKRCSSDSLEKLAGAVIAALLADEVGLGKTIEAGLVLAKRQRVSETARIVYRLRPWTSARPPPPSSPSCATA